MQPKSIKGDVENIFGKKVLSKMYDITHMCMQHYIMWKKISFHYILDHFSNKNDLGGTFVAYLHNILSLPLQHASVCVAFE